MIHKPPMLLVDAVLEENEKSGKTVFAVKNDCIFLDENGVLARPALVEIAAQSFAAIDIYQKMLNGKKPSKGFLVSIRNFEFYEDVKAGDEIICALEETNELAGIHVIEARLYKSADITAKGELRIFELPE